MKTNEYNNSLQRPAVDNSAEPNEEENSGITFSQILHMLKKHWVALIVLSLIGFAFGVVYGRFIKKPKYQSSTQLMIVNSESGEDVTSDQQISTAQRKAGILYVYLTSDEVKTDVAKKLMSIDASYDLYNKDEKKNPIKDDKGNYTYDLVALSNLYAVNLQQVSSGNTSIFVTVTSTAKTAQFAIDIANTVANTTITLCNQKGTNGYQYLNNAVTTLGTATAAKDKSTSNVVVAAVGLLIGVICGAGYGIIAEMTNTHVSSKAELEQITGYKVIGMIPKYNPYVPSATTDASSSRKGGEKDAK